MNISMLIGQFDVIALVLLLAVTVLFWKKKVKTGCWIPGILFGILLPMASIHFEIEKVTSERDVMDNFTLLYTFFKFPFYWILGVVQFAILNRKLTE